jgi:hypothetical protein
MHRNLTPSQTGQTITTANPQQPPRVNIKTEDIMQEAPTIEQPSHLGSDINENNASSQGYLD